MHPPSSEAECNDYVNRTWDFSTPVVVAGVDAAVVVVIVVAVDEDDIIVGVTFGVAVEVMVVKVIVVKIGGGMVVVGQVWALQSRD